SRRVTSNDFPPAVRMVAVGQSSTRVNSTPYGEAMQVAAQTPRLGGTRERGRRAAGLGRGA
ncbi:hypothetical protein, partial [Mycolicibacterium diernhoferi]|uniref:hypothetical protein n=1 Tax=Mycolicibacterium diernhoferi TaxID=1801 RepID=UPI00197B08D2